MLKHNEELAWGVWLAPYRGTNGAMILVSVNSRHERVEELEVPAGGDHAAAQLKLLERLEALEPYARAQLKAI